MWNSSKFFEIKRKGFYLFLRQPLVQGLSSPHLLSPFKWVYERPWQLSLVSTLITLDPFSRLCYNFAIKSVSLSERPFLYDVTGGSLKIWLIPPGSSKSERNSSEEVRRNTTTTIAKPNFQEATHHIQKLAFTQRQIPVRAKL